MLLETPQADQNDQLYPHLAVRVAIAADDRFTTLGLAGVLRSESRLLMTGRTSLSSPDAVQAIACSEANVAVVDASIGSAHEAFERIRQLRARAARIEVVALVRKAPGAVDRAHAAGAIGVVSRTADPQELVGAVLFAARHQPYLCKDLRGSEEFPELTARQESVLKLLAAGMDTQEMSDRLGISPETVKSHIKALLAKLGAHGRAHAVAIAMRRSLIA